MRPQSHHGRDRRRSLAIPLALVTCASLAGFVHIDPTSGREPESHSLQALVLDEPRVHPAHLLDALQIRLDALDGHEPQVESDASTTPRNSAPADDDLPLPRAFEPGRR